MWLMYQIRRLPTLGKAEVLVGMVCIGGSERYDTVRDIDRDIEGYRSGYRYSERSETSWIVMLRMRYEGTFITRNGVDSGVWSECILDQTLVNNDMYECECEWKEGLDKPSSLRVVVPLRLSIVSRNELIVNWFYYNMTMSDLCHVGEWTYLMTIL